MQMEIVTLVRQGDRYLLLTVFSFLHHYALLYLFPSFPKPTLFFWILIRVWFWGTPIKTTEGGRIDLFFFINSFAVNPIQCFFFSLYIFYFFISRHSIWGWFNIFHFPLCHAHVLLYPFEYTEHVYNNWSLSADSVISVVSVCECWLSFLLALSHIFLFLCVIRNTWLGAGLCKFEVLLKTVLDLVLSCT